MSLVSDSKSTTKWYVSSITGIESSELESGTCIVSYDISISSVWAIIFILVAGSSYVSENMALKSSDGTKYNSGIMILNKLL